MNRTALTIFAALAAIVLQAQTNTAGLCRVIDTRRCDIGTLTQRKTWWISVPEGLTTSEVAAVISKLATSDRTLCAASVEVMHRGEKAGAYTVARGTWAPGGEWGRAGEGLFDKARDSYRMSFEFRPAYFARRGPPAWPAEYGLDWEAACSLASELEAACLASSDAVFKRYPAGNKAALEKARAAAIAGVADRYRLTPEKAAAAWERYAAEICSK